ncbi:predicted protein [Micromonas commoda]|uniref:Uncharacterized protein n=1 Tax=Micromonas commoda (strain RCC299 / NOUM17 / CCMP2709) TaxID=296587 RepID=C1FEU0_MICCC|nr:predicted protein [Micromonas commoda]ACO69013.1 predicted protein [Micromonas commoda]|eukprot:XP_002507755.1 predicted protein [Micromonas commoda]
MGHGDGPRKGQSGKSTHVHGGKHVNRGGAFKAHRNVKRAVRDVDAENALRSRACAGVCRRCVQKVQWRFQFGKYKARAPSNKGNCGECKLKTVAFAYRSLCDKCAKERRLCPGCVKPPELARLADGDGAPSDGEGDGDGSSDEDLDGVVITHLSDDDDAGAEA